MSKKIKQYTQTQTHKLTNTQTRQKIQNALSTHKPNVKAQKIETKDRNKTVTHEHNFEIHKIQHANKEASTHSNTTK